MTVFIRRAAAAISVRKSMERLFTIIASADRYPGLISTSIFINDDDDDDDSYYYYCYLHSLPHNPDF